ncbi:N-acetyl-gamma-glutamyl-phosphate reductase [Striga asiatica]|uniref:N-acetyl-gamma-glutamyl-phosphate reductase n=1 Tax=Striga asiatica TaxID=4170 RepID=A0A5A7PU12_STRAF|nr:N-acetyl-gamma-glutamyl-phosphate reductase [Striga asiatica]
MSNELLLVYYNGNWTTEIKYEGYEVCGFHHKETETFDELVEGPGDARNERDARIGSADELMRARAGQDVGNGNVGSRRSRAEACRDNVLVMCGGAGRRDRRWDLRVLLVCVR